MRRVLTYMVKGILVFYISYAVASIGMLLLMLSLHRKFLFNGGIK